MERCVMENVCTLFYEQRWASSVVLGLRSIDREITG